MTTLVVPLLVVGVCGLYGWHVWARGAVPERAKPKAAPPSPPVSARDLSWPIWAAALMLEIDMLPTARFTDVWPDGACPLHVVEEWTCK